VEKRGIMKMMIKNKKGITLVELLAVIVILAIITAIAVPLIGNLITSTRQSAAAADGNTVYTSLRLYALENPEVTTTYDFTTDDDTDAYDRLTAAIDDYISVVPASFDNITFEVDKTDVTVSSIEGAKIGDYEVVWSTTANAFVKP